ncbi:MAG: FAD-dependent oxidoreductase, partial [Lutibacter sp.]|nr:FAD-dependent oxidoreductase [Lutibacter sp.]
MKVDYIIVGLGLAGLAFTKELEKNKKSYIVFEDYSQNSSIVAGGMYNPVILKRFTPVWNAIEQLKIALPFYKELEGQFKKTYNYPIDIFRIFKSVEEQNNWFIASDKPLLANYMDSQIINKKIDGIIAKHGFGRLTNTGRIDTKVLLEDYRNNLLERNLIKNEKFKYDELIIQEEVVEYENIKASKIVFCEGFGL